MLQNHKTMTIRMARKPLAVKYNIANILYGLRQLYKVICQQSGFTFEKTSLKYAIRILSHNLPKYARKVDDHYVCPRCGHYIDNYFCAECGQRIHWQEQVRPGDGKRRQTEYRHRDMDYLYLQERKELEAYVRMFGLDWVLHKLAIGEHDAKPIDDKTITRLVKEVNYQPGDHLSPAEPDYADMMRAREEEMRQAELNK